MKRRSHTCQSDAGFTLLEVLVALSIVAIVVASITKLMVFSTGLVSLNQDYAEAIGVAQQKIEETRALDFTDITNNSGTEGIYSWALTVAVDDPEPGTKTITIQVTWEHKGEQKEYATQTIYAEVTA